MRGRKVILIHDTKDVSVRAIKTILQWLPKENARRKKRGIDEITILQPSVWLWETRKLDGAKFIAGVAKEFGADMAAASSNLGR